MFRKISLVAALAISVLVPTLSNAAYIKLADVPGTFTFLAGNSGDTYRYSSTGGVGTFGTSVNVSGLGSSTPNISLYQTGANAFSSYKMFFVAQGLLAGELDFDYLGTYNGQNNVQKITYNNYIAQNLSIAAPTTGGSIEAMTLNLAGTGYQVMSGFNSNNTHTAFYNDGIVFSASAVDALSNAGNTVPEPSSLALIGLALAGLAVARRKQSA